MSQDNALLGQKLNWTWRKIQTHLTRKTPSDELLKGDIMRDRTRFKVKMHLLQVHLLIKMVFTRVAVLPIKRIAKYTSYYTPTKLPDRTVR